MSASNVVLVTGGAGGIGQATVARLLESGRRVVAVDVNDDALDALRRGAAAAQLMTRLADVTDEASVAELFEWAAAEAGPVNGLVNLAGVNLVAPIEDITLEAWTRVLTLNLTGTFLCCRAAVPLMKNAGGGRIVNMSSIFGIRGEPAEVAYSAAKAGIIGLTRALASEVARYGITVNAVAPVATLTPRVASFAPAFLERQLANIPMGRFGEPSDVAATVNFLLSPDAAFFTGQTFSPNGGDVMP